LHVNIESIRLAAAELHRLRGEHAIATARPPDNLERAERNLRAGLDIATASGAEHFRRRAEQSLKRFAQGPAARRKDTPGKVSSVAELDYRRRGSDA
jgi:hypothetical protein